ncbi:ScbR family autoregulator-binding transcription factor [Streptomyces vilmorinianum]|uniref:ScbR family autoregulator-binding transcription factor n=1 Tax=Streptomyces vilmorinianum TaxID=3051092 RepID=UPI0010FB4011|nr:ScbR family autoregulator-binding transcription factor [Streptomyces vilmorinianum]
MAQQERAIRTRQAILEAAATVFAERGYDGTTIGEVLQRAEVTKGALYFHFSSKEDLALGVLSAQLDFGPLPPQATKLQELVDQGMVLAYRLRREPLVRASVALAIDQGATGVDRAMPFRAWVAQVTEILEAAKAQGELLPHVNVVDTAELFAGAFAGIQTMSQILCEREDLERRVAVLLRHVVPSISVPALLATLDLNPDRGERLFAQYEMSELADHA